MQSEHSVVRHWAGGFDESKLQAWAEETRAALSAAQVSLGLVFMTPRFFPHAALVLEILRVHAKIPLLAGCSSTGLISGSEELEENGGLVLGLFSLPGAKLMLSASRNSKLKKRTGLATGIWRQASMPVKRTAGSFSPTLFTWIAMRG